MGANILKWNRSKERLRAMAEKYYADGNYLAALDFTYKQITLFGEDMTAYDRMADVYENLGLNGYALKWLFLALDIADEEDLPDLYEGIAVNYLNLGRESPSAYYYNLLIGVDDTLTKENKMEIASAFSKDKKDAFRFVWPPELADFTREMDRGSKALKAGELDKAIREFNKIPKGNRDYAEARQMQAVALLLDEKTDEAERICMEVLAEKPDDIQTKATLAAVYLEQGRTEESRRLAEELSALTVTSTEALYKVATVCCENGLHQEAYEKFVELEEKMPCDGKMLYFKAVSAYKCGKTEQAEKTLHKLCTLYPDAAVARYYLRAVRKELAGEAAEKTEIGYFYRLPQTEREVRCRTLIAVGKLPQAEAEILAGGEDFKEDLEWCFDEMDGMDDDLQYLALTVAARVGMDDFVREKLLDHEVADVIKIEVLRILYERNEDMRVGIVLYDVYRSLRLKKIKIGRKKRKKFLESYASVAAKFAIISPAHGIRIAAAAEKLYRAIEGLDLCEIIEQTDDVACALYYVSGLKELGLDENRVASVFDANIETVRLLRGLFENFSEEE